MYIVKVSGHYIANTSLPELFTDNINYAKVYPV